MMDDMVEKEYAIESISGYGNYRLNGVYFPPAVLQGVGKSHAARILTEKVTIDGVPCRKILGFEGILSRDELPKKYLDGFPKFDLYESSASHYEFDGTRLRWIPSDGNSRAVNYDIPTEAEPKIMLDVCPTYVLTVGDIYPENTFQNIMTWLRRAGSRLAKIRKQEKAAWSGKETVDI
jgi:hypothetical protein